MTRAATAVPSTSLLCASPANWPMLSSEPLWPTVSRAIRISALPLGQNPKRVATVVIATGQAEAGGSMTASNGNATGKLGRGPLGAAAQFPTREIASLLPDRHRRVVGQHSPLVAQSNAAEVALDQADDGEPGLQRDAEARNTDRKQHEQVAERG